MNCPFCCQMIVFWNLHVDECKNLPSNYNAKANNISFDDKIFCTRCLLVMKAENYENHRKTLHKKQNSQKGSTKSEIVRI